MSHNCPCRHEHRGDRSVILASSSPRRRWLLEAAAVSFEVVHPPPEAEVHQARHPAQAARQAAVAKAMAVAAACPGRMVAAADTLVVCDGQILGKPQSPDEAERMLAALSGKVHEVYTGIAVAKAGCSCKPEVLADAVVCTRVAFRRLSAEEIAAYVASGEPLDKAGAYAVQGQARQFVEWIDGPWDNVVGLPVQPLVRLLQQAGGTGTGGDER